MKDDDNLLFILRSLTLMVPIYFFLLTRGVYILSDGGISVYGINPQTFSAEGFIAIPNRLLGNDYYAIGMPAETSDSQIGVVATRPGETEVTVTLPNNRDSLRVIYIQLLSSSTFYFPIQC